MIPRLYAHADAPPCSRASVSRRVVAGHDSHSGAVVASPPRSTRLAGRHEPGLLLKTARWCRIAGGTALLASPPSTDR